MKRFAILLVPLALATVTLTATLTAAQTALPDVPDSDGSGGWSLVELQAVWTDLTEDAFKAIDTSADGAVDPAELQAALDGAVIAAPAGN